MKTSRFQKVRVLATANPVDPSDVWLRHLTIPCTWPPESCREFGLHASDVSRAQDFDQALKQADRQTLLVAGKGGYGTFRMLHSFCAMHKIFASREGLSRLNLDSKATLMGFSDCTVLLNLAPELGLLAWHGPMALWPREWPLATEFLRLDSSQIRLHGQLQGELETSGRIIGGNLSVFVSLLGTRFEPDFRDSILFLEDVNESTYRIDRMLMQILHHRDLCSLKGILLGSFRDCHPQCAGGYDRSLQGVLDSFCEDTGLPFVSGLQLGHVENTGILPMQQTVTVCRKAGESLKVALKV